MDGSSSAFRGGGRADPHFALYAAESHALSRGAADLRIEPVRTGDVRGDARRASGRAFDHERDPKHSAGLSEVGANAAPIAMANHSHDAFPGNAAGGSRGAADWLHPDAARRAPCRDV